MNKYRFYIFGLLGMLVIWPLDAFVDVYFFKEEEFLEELFRPSPLEIYFRTTVMFFLLAFSLFAHYSTRKLEQSNKKLHKLSQALEQGGEGVMITDTSGTIEYVNSAFTKITGYHSEEAIGKKPSILKSEAQDPSYYKALWETIAAGDTWSGTLIDKRKDGSFYPAMTSIAPIYDEKGKTTHYVSLQQDMTEYQELEAKYHQAQKMEAIGTLVGGIAHDFNNMLSGITGNVFLAKRKVDDKKVTIEKLENIEALSNRASDMIKQMLAFSRKDKVEMKTFEFTPFFKEAIKLARSGIPENINFKHSTTTQGIFVEGNATQLQQLILNLLNNANDALADTSQPTIDCKVESFCADELFRRTHPDLKAEKFIQLTVSDNGHGIPIEKQNRIFEPFFTTKGAGKGTGLGLSMVFGVVQQHHGVIELESAIDKGATFKVYLPKLEQQVEVISKISDATIQGQGETILLVDDDEDMRQATGEALSELGYQIVVAGNGEEAMNTIKLNSHKFDLLLTDIVMPIMGGVELATSIRQSGKNMPIIFMTGYDKDRALEDGDLDTIFVLSKPFAFTKLSQLIRTTLNNR